MRDILAIDVGTSALKAGVFSPDLVERATTRRPYPLVLRGDGTAEISPHQWWNALLQGCRDLNEYLSAVGVISLAVTSPGLVAMAEDGSALTPAILFMDGRSHRQARWIRERVGDERFLRETCNLPVSGGSSLSSIIWIRENQPAIWEATARFGHCNTYMTHTMTGCWAIDPSTTSITGLYNTARNDLTWNHDVLALSAIPETKLPPLLPSYAPVGRVLAPVADELGVPRDCTVLCGGNDAVLACLSGGVTEPGDISNIHGTCEITAVCLDAAMAAPGFNVRCHVIPNRWMTFFVLNTGGQALEWFHTVFCRDMTAEDFFNDYVPSTIFNAFSSRDADRLEAELPGYVPFLQGSRYSLERLTASFTGLTLATTREQMLLALLRGSALYHGQHLKDLATRVKLSKEVVVTGGAGRIKGMLDVKRRWMGEFEYKYENQSSLGGAAMLGQFYQTKRYP